MPKLLVLSLGRMRTGNGKTKDSTGDPNSRFIFVNLLSRSKLVGNF